MEYQPPACIASSTGPGTHPSIGSPAASIALILVDEMFSEIRGSCHEITCSHLSSSR